MLSQKSIDRIVEEQAGMLPDSIVEHLRKAAFPGVLTKWECHDCGYVGVLIIEDGKLPYTKDRFSRRPGRKWR